MRPYPALSKMLVRLSQDYTWVTERELREVALARSGWPEASLDLDADLNHLRSLTHLVEADVAAERLRLKPPAVSTDDPAVRRLAERIRLVMLKRFAYDDAWMERERIASAVKAKVETTREAIEEELNRLAGTGLIESTSPPGAFRLDARYWGRSRCVERSN